MTLQHRDATASSENRYGPHVNGYTGRQRVVAGFADLMAHVGHHYLVVKFIGDLFPYYVVFQRRRSGHRTNLGNAREHLAPRAVVLRNPQQKVRER